MGFFSRKNKSSNPKESSKKKVVLEGKGSDNQYLIDIYFNLEKRMEELKNRYPKNEYPKKLILITIYHSRLLEFLWLCLSEFFGKKAFNDLDKALIEVNYFIKLYTSIKKLQVYDYYKLDGVIGNFSIAKCNELLKKYLHGDESALYEIEKIHKWYSGTYELGVLFCAMGLMGSDYSEAQSNLLDIQTPNGIDDLTNAQIIFGNNISLMLGKDKKDYKVIYRNNNYNLQIVEKIMSDLVLKIEAETGLEIHKSLVHQPPKVSELSEDEINDTKYRFIVVDTERPPYVVYKIHNRFTFHEDDLSRDIFLCVISIEKDEDGFLLRPNGDYFMDQLDFDDVLNKFIGREIGLGGSYKENDKIYKEYSFIINQENLDTL